MTDKSGQIIQKQAVNLGSKYTNHKMIKFPERSEICLFSMQKKKKTL